MLKFMFNVDNKGIVTKKNSKVYYNNTHGYVFDKNRCNKNRTDNWSDNGASCSSWVMRYENMDYKRRNISDSEWAW